MPSLARLAALFGGLVFCASAMAADVDAESYGYPLANPFEATIATTPPELRPELPADGDIRQRDYSVRLRPDREFELLDNFWPVTKLRYRLAEQKGRAPLIFIIAGTGAHYASGTNEYLKKLFYGAGFHVVQLSSPTSYDFMAAASRFATPGYSPEDADDLYRAMQAVRAQHPRLEVSEFLLTGISITASAHCMPPSSARLTKPAAPSISSAYCCSTRRSTSTPPSATWTSWCRPRCRASTTAPTSTIWCWAS